jgi:hypothetical protein
VYADDVVIRMASQAPHECVSEISYLRTVGNSVMDYMKGVAVRTFTDRGGK